MNLGQGEMVIVVLAFLPGLIAVALAAWLITSVTGQGRRIAHLEERLHMLERRSHTGG